MAIFDKLLKKDQQTNKISDESADEQIKMLLDYYDVDPSKMPEDSQKVIETNLTTIKDSIKSGICEIKKNESGDVHIIHYRPGKTPSQIVYKTLTGRAKIAMGPKKQTDAYGRIYALMGIISGLGEDFITDLPASELKITEAIGLFFLQV